MTEWRLLVAVVLIAGQACLFRGGNRTDPEDPASGFADVTLHVNNANFYDATIYAVVGETRQLVGRVAANSTGRFRFPWHSDRMSFLIHLLAVGSYPTDEIGVSPGDELELLVDPNLHRKPPVGQ